MRRSIVSLYRAVFGILVLAAVVTQLVSLVGKPTFNPVSYFSYFTIDSNLVAATLFLAGSAATRLSSNDRWQLLRGAAVLYMAVTGIVFTLLLSGTDVDTAIPWVNTVLHELMPLVVVADWLVEPPHRLLRVREGMVWLSFPLVWIGYTLIRGALTGRYPYPFLDPVNGGYASVAAYCVAIAVFMALLSVVVVWLGNSVGRGRRPEPAIEVRPAGLS